MPTLEFKGKYHIYAHHFTVPYRPLTPDPARSLGALPDEDNLIIHGDNLHALKARPYCHATPAASNASTSIRPITPVARIGCITTM